VSTPQREYRILFLEDCPEDLALLQRELRKGGVPFVSRRVDTRQDFLVALDEFKPDVIVSDFAMPQFDGLTALRLCRERCSDLPFIFVSGTIGEETAVDALKEGATDYLLKGHTRRLCQALTRAVHEAREREERRKLEVQLSQSQKMEAIGQLAGGIAHDFNNLLTVIAGFAELALSRVKPDAPIADDIREIRVAEERAAELTRQLLAFSRKQIIAPRVLDLAEVVRGVEKLLRRVIGEDLELRVVSPPTLGHVKADRSQVEQVILNLVVNARDALPRGGKITIETADTELDEAYARSHVAVTPGPYVMLAVSDTGVGMSAETKARLFEPFFTTKEKGRGTGLGLATVYGIVKQSGGNIWVYSEPGRGSTFKVYLPRVMEPLDQPAPPRAEAPKGGSESVLVVEDDPGVRQLVVHVLRGQGYDVTEAKDSDEAQRLCEDLSRPLQLLVTDVVMPGMGGRDLSRRIQQVRPGLKVLFVSGYTSDAIVHHGVLEPGLAFLQKPFTPQQLAERVRSILDDVERAGA